MKEILTFFGIDQVDEGIIAFGYKCNNFYIYTIFDVTNYNYNFFEKRDNHIIELWKDDLFKSKLAKKHLQFFLKQYK